MEHPQRSQQARRHHRDGIDRHFAQHLTDSDIKALTRAFEKVSTHIRPLRPGRVRDSHELSGSGTHTA